MLYRMELDGEYSAAEHEAFSPISTGSSSATRMAAVPPVVSIGGDGRWRTTIGFQNPSRALASLGRINGCW